MTNTNKKDNNATIGNTVLDDVFVLVNPEKYDVEKAFIRPWRYPLNSKQNGKQQGYEIEIIFKNGERYYDSSDTILGCKQHFAFKVRSGAVWKNII